VNLDDEVYRVPGQDTLWRVCSGVRWDIGWREWSGLGFVPPLSVDAAVLDRVPIRGEGA
jgi:hypothetical protein